jgi:glycine/D-amino acid oxidase-like deaminating enzyme/nitrite reductase/ring-hydroxylating ferredoxin subunit
MSKAILNTNQINQDEQSKSLWMEISLPSFHSLDTNMNADVCIVGAGIVGLTCAYTLSKEGKSVIVVDQGSIANGQTARTTAHLSWVLDNRYYQLEKLFGEKGIKLIAESHNEAINYIEKIILEEEIDCDFERIDGYLFASPDQSTDVLDKEFVAVQKTGMVFMKEVKAPFSSSFDTGPCLRFPKQAQLHILKYLNGLLKAIIKYGGKIYTHTHISQFKEDSSCVAITQSNLKIASQSIIVATCTPVNNRFFIHTKQSPYRTYVIGASLPKGSVPKALYWDTADPYHYIRTHKHSSNPNLDWLIVGGEDHKTGQDKQIEAKYDELEKWTKERFPMINKIEYQWSGQVFDAIDSLAFIGKNPGNKNIYIATGDSGNGITHGTIAGILIPDLILQKSNPWKNLYEPSRKTFYTAPKFIHENFNVAKQYGDWFTPGEIKKMDNLLPDEGIIFRKGLKKIAVYKDKQNKIHVNSAFCPHLGGCVRWNSGEKSWDCPCHGSRFEGSGKIINGPAISNLYPCDPEQLK